VDTTPPGLVTGLQQVKSAIIQIESQGTFIDPEFGLVLNGAGRGSGFIISPEGIAVTNNHVVTGAALLKVWVGGESKPRNARVVAVSECSDLAVIDIDGDEYNYLDWYDGPIDVGMDVYVAGFPLGDPEYTLTRGVISKAKADGETSWASVDSVIEYDATSNPGYSGGPVVSPDGQVIGIHYAGNASTRQAYGISEKIATRVVNELKAGKNVDSIGINGQAVGTEDGSLTGIWVSSVQSGSPADKAGIQAGDIITSMENLVLATDGTMSDYCDILRSHNATDTFRLEVLRWANGEILTGQLNGRELEVAKTFGTDPETPDPEVNEPAPAGNPNAGASGEFYFSTDFDDHENWYTFAVPDSDTYDATLDRSTLFMEVNSTNSTVYALYDMDLVPSNVRVDAAVETVSGPNRNNISLICRANTDGWYEFSMNSGGYWYIWKYENNNYDLLNQGASRAINLQRAKNELTATCIGTELTFYVNNSKMGSARDNRFKGGGQVGVSVSTFDIPGAGVEFDWFVASVP
jgi:S1-C subfamily serine protease